MMITQTLLRQNAYEMPLAEAIRQTNDALVRNNEQCLFVTVWLAKLELSTGHITYINAGHNPALLTNPAKDKRLWLEELSGPVLGLMPDIPYTRHSALRQPVTSCSFSPTASTRPKTSRTNSTEMTGFGKAS